MRAVQLWAILPSSQPLFQGRLAGPTELCQIENCELLGPVQFPRSLFTFRF